MNPKDVESEIREKLAAIEHERWADWQQWMHSKGVHRIIDHQEYLCFPITYIKHLTRQIDTPYAKLTEKEKDSDREQVDRYWPLILQLLQDAQRRARIDQVHKDLGGYSYSMPMKSARTRNTAFKLYAVKFFNSTLKKRRERQLAELQHPKDDKQDGGSDG